MKKIVVRLGLVGLLSAMTAPVVWASSHLHTYTVAYQGQVIAHPTGFVKDDTTYMSTTEVMAVLKTMNLSPVWSHNNLIIGHPLPVDLPNVSPPKTGTARIYLDGRLFATIPTVNESTPSNPSAPSNQTVTTYIPVWYVMQGLDKIGPMNSWNGHQWTIDNVSSKSSHR